MFRNTVVALLVVFALSIVVAGQARAKGLPKLGLIQKPVLELIESEDAEEGDAFDCQLAPPEFVEHGFVDVYCCNVSATHPGDITLQYRCLLMNARSLENVNDMLDSEVVTKFPPFDEIGYGSMDCGEAPAFQANPSDEDIAGVSWFIGCQVDRYLGARDIIQDLSCSSDSSTDDSSADDSAVDEDETEDPEDGDGFVEIEPLP